MDIIFSIIPYIFWFLIILIPLIAIHEFGHLLIARLFGVKVPEYGIGMPPRWLSKKWKGIVWSLNALPLGGFVRIYGDNDAIHQAADQARTNRDAAKEEYIKNRFVEILANRELEFFLQDNNLDMDEDWVEFEKVFLKKQDSDEKNETFEKLAKQLETLIEWEFETALDSTQTFFSKNLFQQVAILLGGVTFNMIAAFVLFFVIFSTVTPPSPMFAEDLEQVQRDNVTIVSQADEISVAQVETDSPAYQAGLRNTFEILEIGETSGSDIQSNQQFRDIIQDSNGDEIPVTFRDPTSGDITTTTINPDQDGDRYMIGIMGFGRMVQIRSNDVITTVRLAWGQTWNLFFLQFDLVGQIATSWLPNAENPNAAENVGGPVAISKIGGTVFDLYGLPGILNLIAMISIGLAVFNLLPIPALDGGRIVIVVLSKVFGWRNRRLEAVIINVTFIALMGLAVVIAIKDFGDIASGRFG